MGSTLPGVILSYCSVGGSPIARLVIHGHLSIAGRLGLAPHHPDKPVLQAGAGRHRHFRAHGFNPVELHLAHTFHLGLKCVMDDLHQTRVRGSVLVGTLGQVLRMYEKVPGHVYEERTSSHRPERRIDLFINGACRLDRIHDLGYPGVQRFQRVHTRQRSANTIGFYGDIPRYTPSANPVVLMEWLSNDLTSHSVQGVGLLIWLDCTPDRR